jgi:hypothetical protein
MSEPLDNEQLQNTPSQPILPIAQALLVIAPDYRWHLEGYHYEGLVWEDNPSVKPSKEVVEELARKILNDLPMQELQRQRDKRFRDVDWVTLRSYRTGVPIPQEWLDYMQALADITATHQNPKLENGKLVNINWPERPDGIPAGPYRPGMLRA